MKKGLTEIVFILDRSGSMGGLEADTIGGYNSLIEKQKKETGEAYISTVLFDDKVEIYYNYIDKKSPDEFEHQAFLFYTENVDLYIKDDYKLKEQDYILNMLIQMFI